MLLIAVAGTGVWGTLLELLVLLAVAMLFGFLAERFKQSAMVGYLVAGTLVGPNALGWVSSQEQIFVLAEFGVSLLLFTIGLEFSLQELRKLGRIPLISGLIQVPLTMLLAMVIPLVFGVSFTAAVVIGAMITLSSTASVLRILRDRAEIDSQFGRVALGILLIQDVAVVPLVILVTSMTEGGSWFSVAGRISLSLVLSVLLVGAFYLVFNWSIPKVLLMPTWRRNRDLPVLLTTCMVGGAAWAAHSMNLSPALGAFVAGVLLAVSPFALQIQADIQPLRALFVTLFFAAIGMFGNVHWFLSHLGLVFAIFAAIILGKIVVISSLTRWAGLPWQFAIATGFCLAQIGEFAFVLGTIGRSPDADSSLLSNDMFLALVSATILALLATPYLIAVGPRLGAWLERRWQRTIPHYPLPEKLVPAADLDPDRLTACKPDGIIIVGFGPAGQRVAQELMLQHQDSLTVVELNLDNIQIAREWGLVAHLGDATQTDIWHHAEILTASSIVITVPNPASVRQIISQARHLAPSAMLFVRCRYHIYHWALAADGADVVIDEEEQVGLQIALEVQKQLDELDEGHRQQM